MVVVVCKLTSFALNLYVDKQIIDASFDKLFIHHSRVAKSSLRGNEQGLECPVASEWGNITTYSDKNI